MSKKVKVISKKSLGFRLPPDPRGVTKFYSNNDTVNLKEVHVLVNNIDLGHLPYSVFVPDCSQDHFPTQNY